MPRIRRWFHVSHDINSDPEVWEMRDRFGERALGVWLEVLSISDRHDGLVPGDIKYLSSTLAGKCKTKTKTVEGILEYATDKEWIVYDPVRRVRNHLKYRPTRDAKHIPTRDTFSTPSSPTHSSPTHSSPTRTTQKHKSTSPLLSPQGGTALNGFKEFWNRYPRKEGIGKAEEAWKKHAKGVALEEILAGIVLWEQSEKWREGFIPMPTTWLNQKRWKDTPLIRSKISQADHLWREAQAEKEEQRDPKGSDSDF